MISKIRHLMPPTAPQNSSGCHVMTILHRGSRTDSRILPNRKQHPGHLWPPFYVTHRCATERHITHRHVTRHHYSAPRHSAPRHSAPPLSTTSPSTTTQHRVTKHHVTQHHVTQHHYSAPRRQAPRHQHHITQRYRQLAARRVSPPREQSKRRLQTAIQECSPDGHERVRLLRGRPRTDARRDPARCGLRTANQR